MLLLFATDPAEFTRETDADDRGVKEFAVGATTAAKATIVMATFDEKELIGDMIVDVTWTTKIIYVCVCEIVLVLWFLGCLMWLDAVFVSYSRRVMPSTTTTTIVIRHNHENSFLLFTVIPPGRSWILPMALYFSESARDFKILKTRNTRLDLVGIKLGNRHFFFALRAKFQNIT